MFPTAEWGCIGLEQPSLYSADSGPNYESPTKYPTRYPTSRLRVAYVCEVSDQSPTDQSSLRPVADEYPTRRLLPWGSPTRL